MVFFEYPRNYAQSMCWVVILSAVYRIGLTATYIWCSVANPLRSSSFQNSFHQITRFLDSPENLVDKNIIIY